MSKYDFVINYKTPLDTSWRQLGLNRSYFPPSACDEDISMEIREYLYLDLEKIKDYKNQDTESLDSVIDNLVFKNGSLFNEALLIHSEIHNKVFEF